MTTITLKIAGTIADLQVPGRHRHAGSRRGNHDVGRDDGRTVIVGAARGHGHCGERDNETSHGSFAMISGRSWTSVSTSCGALNKAFSRPRGSMTSTTVEWSTL